VLRLANSALFGRRYEVTSILHAISVLGIDRLKALVLTVGMRDFLAGRRQAALIKKCWRHNLGCAIAAEWLANFVWVDKSQAYTAGLLHDLGRLALMMVHPDRYGELVTLAEASGRELGELERIAFGTTAREAGAWVAAEWNLPQQMRSVVCTHGVLLSPCVELDCSGVAALACRLADWTGFSVIAPAPEWDPDSVRACAPPELWSKIEPRTNELLETIPFRINAFECEFLN
jgi:hypothetical protein